jgi:hypothetical protein
MPRGDGTGPVGMGPMTGRGAGFCAGYSGPGYMNAAGGRGYWGRGRGGGRGWRHWYHATGMPGWARTPMGYPAWSGPVSPYAGPFAPAMTAEQELDGLKKQAEHFQDALGQINQRIEQLEAEANK